MREPSAELVRRPQYPSRGQSAVRLIIGISSLILLKLSGEQKICNGGTHKLYWTPDRRGSASGVSSAPSPKQFARRFRRQRSGHRQIAIANERRGEGALEGLPVRGHRAGPARPRRDGRAAAGEPCRHHLPWLDVFDLRRRRAVRDLL